LDYSDGEDIGMKEI